jgi:hypothetical protein
MAGRPEVVVCGWATECGDSSHSESQSSATAKAGIRTKRQRRVKMLILEK